MCDTCVCAHIYALYTCTCKYMYTVYTCMYTWTYMYCSCPFSLAAVDEVSGVPLSLAEGGRGGEVSEPSARLSRYSEKESRSTRTCSQNNAPWKIVIHSRWKYMYV